MSKKFIAIIDYEVGNTHSVYNALTRLGYKAKISNSKTDIENAGALILPGVGSFAEAMQNLRRHHLIDLLNEEVLIKKKNILGICLGMQILANDSEEDPSGKGLGWINGSVKKIKGDKDLRVPQVGWNNLSVSKKEELYSKHIPEANFYFDHSFHLECDKKYISATCEYGSILTASVQRENIFGVQFHPEKSDNNGLKLFRSFFNYLKF